MIERRQILKGMLAGLGGLAMPRLALSSQAGTPLTPSVSVLTDVGTNVVVHSSTDGLTIVDSGSPQFADRLIDHLAEWPGGSQAQTVFNTHYHIENTGTNDALGRNGARIMAHENTRLWMATPYWIPAEERYQEPRARAAHPGETFYTEGSMNAGAEQIEYGYLIEAHTSGDIFVYFRDANVLAAGDVVSPARDPELDYFTGAWLGGRLDAMDRILEITDEETRIVPGYGPVVSRDELRIEREIMGTIYERTVDLARQGDSARDMFDAGVMDGLGRSWDEPYKFLDDVYQGLWAHHNKLAPNVV